MKDLILKKGISEKNLYIVKSADGKEEYSISKEKENLLTKKYLIKFNDQDIANMDCQHIVFEKVNMPKVEVICQGGVKFVLRKEMEQLKYKVVILDKTLKIQGNVYSKSYELIYRENKIAVVNFKNEDTLISVDEKNEKLAVIAILAIESIK